MKKFLYITLILVLTLGCLTVPGCGDNGETGNEKQPTPATPAPSLTEEPTPATPAPTVTEEPTPLPITTPPPTTPTPPQQEPTPVHIPPTASLLEMVSIPAGSFQMGDLSGGGDDDERPVHSVTLSPFNISAYEITHAQWMKVEDWGESHGYSFIKSGLSSSVGNSFKNHPVSNIYWYNAVLWCNALSEMEGRTPCYYTSSAQSTVYRSHMHGIRNDGVKWNANGYRLPTEAEWEYACRAKTTTAYSFGDSIDHNDANYIANHTTPVGSYAPNNWGLYDMHGNVWEWCWDRYDSYSSSSENNPHGPSWGSIRVVRGGRWDGAAEHLRSAIRGYFSEGDDNCYVGFRPVCSQ